MRRGEWTPERGTLPRPGRTEAAVLQVVARIVAEGVEPTADLIAALCIHGPVSPDRHAGQNKYVVARYVATYEEPGWSEYHEAEVYSMVLRRTCRPHDRDWSNALSTLGIGESARRRGWTVTRVEDVEPVWQPSPSTIAKRLRDLITRGLLFRDVRNERVLLMSERGATYAQELLLGEDRVVLP